VNTSSQKTRNNQMSKFEFRNSNFSNSAHSMAQR